MTIFLQWPFEVLQPKLHAAQKAYFPQTAIQNKTPLKWLIGGLGPATWFITNLSIVYFKVTDF